MDEDGFTPVTTRASERRKKRAKTPKKSAGEEKGATAKRRGPAAARKTGSTARKGRGSGAAKGRNGRGKQSGGRGRENQKLAKGQSLMDKFIAVDYGSQSDKKPAAANDGVQLTTWSDSEVASASSSE